MDVVIPTMNKDSTEAVCAYYLSSNSLPLARIVVVDLAPNEGGLEALAAQTERLIYQPVFGQAYFNKSLALNIGFSVSKENQVLFCDADVMVDHKSLGNLIENVKNGHSFHIDKVVETAGSGVRSGPGIVSVTRANFLNVGGYNSYLTGWGYEDRDFIDRLRLSGCSVKSTGLAFHLSHPDTTRVQNYEDEDLRSSRNRNFRTSERMINESVGGSYYEDIGLNGARPKPEVHECAVNLKSQLI